MTKEELKQEAEKSRLSTKSGHDLSYDPKYREVYDKAYIAGAEPREKRIAELEKENAELKNLKDVADLIRLNNSHIVAMAQLNNNNVALRKENAELKDEYRYLLDVKDNQLTKAKELLNEFMRISKASDEDFEHDYSELIGETEQFLNSEVEK